MRPLLYELYRDTKPGMCATCDMPLPRRMGWAGRPRRICGHPECVRLYITLWRRAWMKKKATRGK